MKTLRFSNPTHFLKNIARPADKTLMLNGVDEFCLFFVARWLTVKDKEDVVIKERSKGGLKMMYIYNQLWFNLKTDVDETLT